MRKITIATCQHNLTANVSDNLRITLASIKKASESGAEIIQFPECNLTGYAGVEFSDFPKGRNREITGALSVIKEQARKLRLWVIVGGYWYADDMKLPYNSLFVVNSKGMLECRYDKRMLTAGDSGDDVDYFYPGKDPDIFIINGIKCGLLICHEWRYPELYREYKRLGVELVFQSWYDAGVNPQEYQKTGKNHGSLIIGSVRSNAANNYLWISGSNACNRESSFGSFHVQPDGVVAGKLSRNRSGMLIGRINPDKHYIDPSGHNREKFL